MPNECREHHFGSDGRCKICQMQARYYYEGVATLKDWTRKEIIQEAKRYQSLLDSIKCKPHTHADFSNMITEAGPLAQLYDMEGNQ